MNPINPEFRRQLWLELSPLRLIVLPIILGLIFYVSVYEDDNLANLYNVNISIFICGLLLYGSFKSANSFVEEISESTWDFQKMSPQSAWKLAFGKLFGGSCYAWYAFFICLPFFLAGFEDHFNQACINQIKYWPQNPDYINNVVCEKISIPNAMLFLSLGLFFSGIFAHSISLLIAIHNSAYKLTDKKLSAFGYAIIGTVISGFILQIVFKSIDSQLYAYRRFPETFIWFGKSWNTQFFIIASLVFFTCWTIVGLWQSMRKELQYSDIPVAWILFMISIILYFCGMIDRGFDRFGNDMLDVFTEALTPENPILFALPALLKVQLYLALIITLAATYIWSFLEARHIVQYRQFFFHFKKLRFIKTLKTTPKWFINAFFAGTLLSILILSSSAGNLILWGILLLFVMRDIVVMHVFFLAGKNTRASLAFFVYGAVVYILLPLISPLTKFFIPTFEFNDKIEWSSETLFISLFFQLIVALFLLALRLRSKTASKENKKDRLQG